jgi:FAD/FMN-containing dehydrogenase
MTVLAGTTLQGAQEAALEADFELALDLGARGSCQIGGNPATNVGGNRVIQSCTAREQVLGLAVVLASGAVLSSIGRRDPGHRDCAIGGRCTGALGESRMYRRVSSETGPGEF